MKPLKWEKKFPKGLKNKFYVRRVSEFYKSIETIQFSEE